MLRWRRFIAIFLLLAFMPASLLAAMPLVWCIGDDGHHGVEYSISSTAKHIEHHALGVQPNGAAEATAPEGDCQDWQLVAKAKSATAQDGAGVLSFAERPVVLLRLLQPSRQTGSPLVSQLPSRHGPIPDVRREALRSVVLLI